MADPPSPDVDLRCAPWTAAHGFDPIGSAVVVDRLVTVEVPQPWPAKIEELAWLSGLPEPAATRVQAIVPETPRAGGTVLVNRWQRVGALLQGTDWLLRAADVPDVLAAVVQGHDPVDAEATPAPPEVLVCAHGTRDRCCGGGGTRLAIEARAQLPDVRIRRTSHLGGHRFAPTALTLPDGRQWSHLDPDVLSGIVRRTLDPSIARAHYRGNIALEPWAQVVEGAVLADHGWELAAATTLRATSSADGDRARVTVRWDDPSGTHERTGEVTVSRRYPVLQCGLPPEEATKEALEYGLTD